MKVQAEADKDLSGKQRVALGAGTFNTMLSL